MARSMAAKVETSIVVLEAAKKVLRQNGYSKLSTRDVAAAAGVPLSQIHYHFGSKQGMVLALFEHLNSQLLDRQDAMFHDSTLTLSQQWDRACDYFDEDIASGYVRVLQELIAASWADSPVAKVIQAALMGWFKLLVELARRAEREFGHTGWTVAMQRIEQSEPETDAGCGYAKRAAEITQHLSDQGIQLVVVDISHDSNLLKVQSDRKLRPAKEFRSNDQIRSVGRIMPR